MNSEEKNRVLRTLAHLLSKNTETILDYNIKDLNSLKTGDPAIKERLKLDKRKINNMISSLTFLSGVEDPEGKELYRHVHTNGLQIVNRQVPFGRILIIYESRPDVTIEAAAVAFKTGNEVLLKGGNESRYTNLYLSELWNDSLSACNMSKSLIRYLDYDRSKIQELIKGKGIKIDLIIPRGGADLINYIKANSTVPVIVGGKGNNFLYIHSCCDFDMAIKIVLDGKRRKSVCNALDKVLIDVNIPDFGRFFERLIKELNDKDLDPIDYTSSIISDTNHIGASFTDLLQEEFLSSRILLCSVTGPEMAVEIINTFSGGHSAGIVTNDNDAAASFLLKTDCAAVYHNASIRFTDGNEFGLGGEIAISTQKLHFRGPIGFNNMLTNKWFITGNGHIRD